MVQGAENDLKDIRFYTNTSSIYFVDDNEPVQDLNDNVLTVDTKAVLAKTIANQATTDFTAHRGSGGVGVHAEATETVSGFMSAADKIKIDTIDAEAQLNILSPPDALELVGRQPTKLHIHPTVTTTLDGFMGTADKSKLDGIEFGANVNNISDANATTLTGGPSENAQALHTHVEPPFVETFRETPEHFNEDHTGILGVTPFSGLQNSPYNLSPGTAAQTTLIFTHTFPFTPISVHGGIANATFDPMNWPFFWGGVDFFGESFSPVVDLEVSGNDGILTYASAGPKGRIQVWIGGYGN